MLKSWTDLPDFMRTDSVKPYYDEISNKKVSLLLKRIFDITIACLLLIILSPVLLIVAIAIKSDSEGPILFRQERVTQYGKHFNIYKFRTMVDKAESLGTQVTVENDSRITNVGNAIRKYRIDEFPQLINVIKGDMSFVGTRPEVPKYVKMYTPEMYATLLLPAGITSKASIKYKDEDEILASSNNVDEAYVKDVLPEKMKYNLQSLREFNAVQELFTMVWTVLAVI